MELELGGITEWLPVFAPRTPELSLQLETETEDGSVSGLGSDSEPTASESADSDVDSVVSSVDSVLVGETELQDDLQTLSGEGGSAIMLDQVVARSSGVTPGVHHRADPTMVYAHATRATSHLADSFDCLVFACQRKLTKEYIWLENAMAGSAPWPRCLDCFPSE